MLRVEVCRDWVGAEVCDEDLGSAVCAESEPHSMARRPGMQAFMSASIGLGIW